MNERRPEGSFLNGESGRISPDILVKNPYFRNTLLFLTIVGGLAAAWEISGRPTYKDYVDPVRDSVSLESIREYHGKPIEEEEPKVLVTDRFLGNDLDFVPVRSDPTRDDSNIIGWAPFEQEVVAEAYYGVTYPGGSTSSNGLGQIEGPDGKVYGKWYFIHQIDVYVLDENGEWLLRPRFNVFVGGNYLKQLETDINSSTEN